MVIEAADTAPGPSWKERVQAASRLLNLPFARAKAFYYRAPRVVTAEEMDHARAAIRALREQRRATKHAEHIAWLSATVTALRGTSDPDLVGTDLSRLERVLARVGAPGSALGDPGAAEDHDQSREWGGYAPGDQDSPSF